jgi:hypothetical protein
MRDLIWTVIVVWFVYKLIDIFRGASAKKSFSGSNHQSFEQTNTTHTHTTHSKEDIKSAVQKHINNEGEYVDFEEVK